MLRYETALYLNFNPDMGELIVPETTRQMFTNPRHLNWSDVLYSFTQQDFGNLVGEDEHLFNLYAANERLPITGRYSLGEGRDSVTVHNAPDEGSTYIWPTSEANLLRPLSCPFKFRHGMIVTTPGAMLAYQDFHISPLRDLSRHMRGDWGDVCAEDWEENELSLREGYRLLSSYEVGGERCWWITEADRSSTCALLPAEY